MENGCSSMVQTFILARQNPYIEDIRNVLFDIDCQTWILSLCGFLNLELIDSKDLFEKFCRSRYGLGTYLKGVYFFQPPMVLRKFCN